MGLNVFGYWKPNRVKEKGEVNKKVKSSGEVKKKVKSLGAHYKDTEKSVISIVKYLDETLETLDGIDEIEDKMKINSELLLSYKLRKK